MASQSQRRLWDFIIGGEGYSISWGPCVNMVCVQVLHCTIIGKWFEVSYMLNNKINSIHLFKSVLQVKKRICAFIWLYF